MGLDIDLVECEDNDESAHSSMLNDIRKLDGNNLRFGQEKETRVILESSYKAVTSTKLSKILDDRKIIKKRKSLKILEKPLEKPAAKRLKRAVGYQEVAEDVNKWEGIVNSRRRAEQLSFPLKKVDLRVKTSIENSKIVPTTDLQKNVYTMLYGEALTPPIGKTEQEKAMSLKEIKLKSKELWQQRKLRERLERKAAFKNKSKSKKFHRIQKREKLRKEKEEFDKLKLTDPEAALEKLEEIELSRIAERMSQRHRSSKWLHLQNTRAGHDNLARQVVNETKDIAKELLEKYKKTTAPVDNESDDEEDLVTEKILMRQEKDLQDGVIDINNRWVSQLALPLKPEAPPPTSLLKLNKYWEERNKMKERDNIAMKVAEENLKTMNEKADEVKPHEQLNTGDNNEVEDEEYTDVSDDETINNEKETIPKKLKNKKNTKIVKKRQKSKLQTPATASVNGEDDENFTDIKNEGLSTDKKSNKVMKSKKLKKKRLIEKSGNVKEEQSSNKKLKLKKKSNKLAIDRSLIKATKSGKKLKSKKKISEDYNIDEIMNDFQKKMLETCEQRYKEMEARDKEHKEEMIEIYKSKNNRTKKKHSNNLEFDFSVVNEDELCEEGLGRTRTLEDLKKLQQKSTENHLDTKSTDESGEGKNVEEDTAQNASTNVATNIKFRRLRAAPSFEKFGSQFADEPNSDDELIDEVLEKDELFQDFQDKKAEHEAEKRKRLKGKGRLKGWGSWVGPNGEGDKPKRTHLSTKPYEKRPTKHWKPHIVYNEGADLHSGIRSRMVSQVPYPFTSTKDFEASIRQPISRLFVPEIVHRKLIAKPIITKMGTVIKPMDEEALVSKVNQKTLLKRLEIVKAKNNKLKKLTRNMKGEIKLIK